MRKFPNLQYAEFLLFIFLDDPLVTIKGSIYIFINYFGC